MELQTLHDTAFFIFRQIFLPYVFLSVALFVYLIYRGLEKGDMKGDVLIITAHPDDECLLFSPTILRLARKKCSIDVLCLSTGNYYHEGKKRVVELYKSCSRLGIEQENVTVIDHRSLQDDIEVIWDKSTIADIIRPHIDRLQPNIVLTFDSYGVTGHKNHLSIYHALRFMLAEGQIASNVHVYALDSISWIRNYMTFHVLDILPSTVSTDNMIISDMWDYVSSVRACLAHRSQMKWFRVLHMVLSRYMTINTWQRLDIKSQR